MIIKIKIVEKFTNNRLKFNTKYIRNSGFLFLRKSYSATTDQNSKGYYKNR